MSKRITLTILIIIGSALPCFSAHEVGINLQLGSPRGEFSNHLDNPGIGFGGQFAWALSSHVSIGAGGGFLWYGQEVRPVMLPLGGDFEVKTNNYIANSYLSAQINLWRGPVIPYLEGRWGFNYLWTESHIEDLIWGDDVEISSEINQADGTSQYAYGAGFKIRLYSNDEEEYDTMLDLRVMKSIGGDASYLTAGDVEVGPDTRLLVYPSHTATDLVYFQVGLLKYF